MSGRTHPSYWSAHHPHFPDDSAPAYAVGAEAPTVADYGRNESESICMEVEEAMDILLKVIQDETALVRSGMLVAAGELDARKKEAARRYVAAVDRVRTAAPMLERMAPHAIDRLKRRNENFRSVLQLNLAALAAAREVSENLIRSVAEAVDVSPKSVGYGRAGVVESKSTGPNAIALDRSL
jgi:hypothetical protein